MATEKSIIYLVQSYEQPRIIKRIIDSVNNFDSVKIYGFSRKLHNVNNFSKLDAFDNISYEILGEFKNRSYINRISLYLKLFLKIYIKYFFKKIHIYSFGLDLRLLSSFMPNKYRSYEISDIVWLYMNSTSKGLLRNIDNILAKTSDRVIFTSKGFYDKYYAFLDNDKVEILENRLKTFNKVSPIQNIKVDKIRISYIGAFRYKTIIRHLIQVCAELSDKVELDFYGDGDKELIKALKDDISNYDNIRYHGKFRNPDDLQEIYSNTNLNFGAYDNTLENELVAMPNKYYESGFFNIPIVASKNTYVGERIVNNGMGWLINPTSTEIKKFLNKLTVNDLIRCSKQISNLDKKQFYIK